MSSRRNRGRHVQQQQQKKTTTTQTKQFATVGGGGVARSSQSQSSSSFATAIVQQPPQSSSSSLPSLPNASKMTPQEVATRKKVLQDYTREYVSGGIAHGWMSAYTQYVKTLPPYVDDLTQRFGIEIYQKMMRDPQVKASIKILKLGTLSGGWKMESAVQDDFNEDYEQAGEIAEFVKRNLNGLQLPFLQILMELLDGLAYGHKVAEKTFEVEQDTQSQDKGKLMLKSLKVKPNEAVTFVVDQFMNLVGLYPTYSMQGAGMGAALRQGMGLALGNLNVQELAARGVSHAAISSLAEEVAGTGSGSVNKPGAGASGLSSLDAIIGEDKFIIFRLEIEDEDPRGVSTLRAAYNPWWIKTQIYGEWLKYLAQFGTPTIWGTTAPDAEDVQMYDTAGNPIIDQTTGLIATQTPQEAMLDVVLNTRNSTGMIFQHGAELHAMEMSGNGEAFDTAFFNLNRELVVSILFQHLATGEARHASGDSTSSHLEVLKTLIGTIKDLLAVVIQKGIVYPLVLYNYGREAAENLCPKFALPEIDQNDFAKIAQAIASLWRYGYLHDSQLQGLDAMMNLPARDMKAQMRDNQQAQKAPGQELDLQNPNDPNVATGGEPVGAGGAGAGAASVIGKGKGGRAGDKQFPKKQRGKVEGDEENAQD